MDKKRVLFICEDNASVSQLAEAIVNARMSGLWEAVSAGVKPAPTISPETREILAELGINYQGSTKPIESVRGQQFDLVIAFCDNPFTDCPEWLRHVQHMRVEVHTPAELAASACCTRGAYRILRREITRRVPEALGIWIVNRAIASDPIPASFSS